MQLHLSTFEKEAATSGLDFVAGLIGGLLMSGALLDLWSQVLRPADPAERRLVWTAVLIGMSQQFTGTEAILCYAPQIFSKLGSGTQFIANLGVGGCKFVGELISAALAERVGR